MIIVLMLLRMMGLIQRILFFLSDFSDHVMKQLSELFLRAIHLIGQSVGDVVHRELIELAFSVELAERRAAAHIGRQLGKHWNAINFRKDLRLLILPLNLHRVHNHHQAGGREVIRSQVHRFDEKVSLQV